MTYTVRSYHWKDAPPAVKGIRSTVFIDEQQVPDDLEWDSEDETALHFLLFENETPVAVARLIQEEENAKIGRMAVLKTHRGKGAGAELMKALVRACADLGIEAIRLSAQTHAQPFYQRFGFFPKGDIYPDAGIDHVDMFNPAPALLFSRETLPELPFRLAHDDTSYRYQSASECEALTRYLIAQTERDLDIYSANLDPSLLDSDFVTSNLTKLLKHNRRAKVRLLVQDEKPLIKRPHRLVELHKRLSSRIELKIVNTDYPFEESAFILVDRDGFSFREDAQQLSGFANFNSPHNVKRYRDKFDLMWTRGAVSRELRPLGI